MTEGRNKERLQFLRPASIDVRAALNLLIN